MLQSRTENIRWKCYRNKKYSINPGKNSFYNRAKFNLTHMKYKAFPKTNAQTKSKQINKILKNQRKSVYCIKVKGLTLTLGCGCLHRNLVALHTVFRSAQFTWMLLKVLSISHLPIFLSLIFIRK